MNIVYAGGNNTSNSYVVNESVKDINNDEVVALEDGHFNTSFSDGSNGYCLEYGEQEASSGDKFYKVDTSYARNNVNNVRVGNYIKLFFVDYTDYALSDKVRTQHYIWHFTDDFNGWRLNYTIIEHIKESDKVIPDYYVQRLNDTCERVWLFNVLLSPYEHHQDYFAYKFFDRNITASESDMNISLNKSDVVKDNVSLIKKVFNKTVINQSVNIYEVVEINESMIEVRGSATNDSLNMMVVGYELYNSILILLFGLVFTIGIYIIHRR